MKYNPQPFDVGSIIIPDELKDLVEKITKNVHEIWALGRKTDGWKYGPKRNDDEKTNPCLVPFEALPEEEKKYDERIAKDTIKTIFFLEYQITKSRGINDERE